MLNFSWDSSAPRSIRCPFYYIIGSTQTYKTIRPYNLINTSLLSESSDSGLMPIENLIHIIQGQQAMLDSDLAKLYGVETRVLINL